MKPEDQLRRLSDDDRWIDEASWNQRRTFGIREPKRLSVARRWVPVMSAAAVALAAAGVAVAAWLHPDSSSEQRSAVPHPNSTIPWKALSASNDFVLAADNEICDPSALRAVSAAPSQVMGAYRLKIKVTNEGIDCALPNDKVTLRSTDTSGADVVLASVVGDTPNAAPAVAQGEALDYFVEFDPACVVTDAQLTRPIALGIAGTDVTVDGAKLPDALTTCSRIEFTAPPAEDDESAYPGLTADVTAPAAIGGSSLDYTVTLTNTGTRVLTFKDCPVYKEVGDVYGKGRTSQTYRLNCASARTIDPGRSITYAMRLHLPAAHGRLKIGWFLDHGPSSATSLRQ